MEHLISHEHKPLLLAEDDDLLEVIVAEDVAGGVARVDHDEGFGQDAVGPCLVHASLQPLHIKAQVKVEHLACTVFVSVFV